MEWCWWPWLTSKRVARVCQHQLNFLLSRSTKFCFRFVLLFCSFVRSFICLDVWVFLFVTQNYSTVFHKNSLKCDTWTTENWLDFADNPGSRYVRVGVRVGLGWHYTGVCCEDRVIPRHWIICFTRRLFNSNNFAGSTALPEVWCLTECHSSVIMTPP